MLYLQPSVSKCVTDDRAQPDVLGDLRKGEGAGGNARGFTPLTTSAGFGGGASLPGPMQAPADKPRSPQPETPTPRSQLAIPGLPRQGSPESRREAENWTTSNPLRSSLHECPAIFDPEIGTPQTPHWQYHRRCHRYSTDMPYQAQRASFVASVSPSASVPSDGNSFKWDLLLPISASSAPSILINPLACSYKCMYNSMG